MKHYFPDRVTDKVTDSWTDRCTVEQTGGIITLTSRSIICQPRLRSSERLILHRDLASPVYSHGPVPYILMVQTHSPQWPGPVTFTLMVQTNSAQWPGPVTLTLMVQTHSPQRPSPVTLTLMVQTNSPQWPGPVTLTLKVQTLSTETRSSHIDSQGSDSLHRDPVQSHQL